MSLAIIKAPIPRFSPGAPAYVRGVALLALGTLLLGASQGCASGAKEGDEAMASYAKREESPTKPGHQARSRDFYEARLRQLPLRIDERYQDLSRTDSAKAGAWMTDLYYSNTGRRDLYALWSNDHLYAMSAEDFILSWTVNLERRPLYPPAFSDSFIYFLTREPRAMWFYREKQPSGYQKRQDKHLQIQPGTAPAANDQAFFVGADEFFRVVSFDDEHVQERWFWPKETKGQGRMAFRPVADKDRVYFYTEGDESLWSITASTGQTAWRRPFTQPITAPFRIKRDMIFVGGWDTKLYALDKSSKVIFYFPAQEPIVSQPYVVFNQPHYYIYFQTPRYLYCIRTYFVDTGSSDEDGGTGARVLRLASPEGLADGTESPDVQYWRLPLVGPEYFRTDEGDAIWRKKHRDRPRPNDLELLDSPARRNVRVLMLGRKWLYLLVTLKQRNRWGEPIKRLYRVRNDGAPDERGRFETTITGTGQNKKTELRYYDMTDFPIILTNDDDPLQYRRIYVGTNEGFIFALTEAP